MFIWKRSCVLKIISQSLFVKWFYFPSFYNNFSYTQLTFVFHLQEDFYMNNIFVFCFSLLQRDFYIIHNHIDVFCFFLLQKDLDSFHGSFFEILVCWLDNIQTTIFMYRRQISIKINSTKCLGFFCLINFLCTMKN